MLHKTTIKTFSCNFYGVSPFISYYDSTIRGFHVYRKTWQPTLGQILDCYHESNNVFDLFAIKVCEKDSQKVVGQLPKEISRATKFIIDRGAVVTVEISSDHYRRSPLVQGGLEVPCNITVKTHPSFNLNVLKKYKELVNTLYAEPENEEIIGTFISMNSQPSVSRPEVSSKDDGGRRKYKN